MSIQHSKFNESHVLKELRHYLPSQAPLKDFIHHNTLHAFQDQSFFEGIFNASKIFGYRVSLNVEDYRTLFLNGLIKKDILERSIASKKRPDVTLDNMLNKQYETCLSSKVGLLRGKWKDLYKIDLTSLVNTSLFRILNSYLDQGIAIWKFPVTDQGFLHSLRTIEKNNFSSLFKTKRARNLLLNENLEMIDLLNMIVGSEDHFEQYLFDQQFTHPGWSGLICVLEDTPHTLLDQRKISLKDLIILELILEIDALTYEFKDKWWPLSQHLNEKPVHILEKTSMTELDYIISTWHEAYEWSYYDQVLAGLKKRNIETTNSKTSSFQAIFCIDDRECSVRRYIESYDPTVKTYGTPGHFNIEFYYQPEFGKFHTKVCPAPITPKYLIKEYNSKKVLKKDIHFEKRSHRLVSGWLISQTIGFWSAVKLFVNVFKPSSGPASASSFRHMDQDSSLTFEHQDGQKPVHDLQLGFTVTEMANRLEGVLKSIGLVNHFAPLVYVIGHGASSVNNTHYAGYDCGACSGRPGSVNARVFCAMANHPKVREVLATRDIVIPAETQFLGGLHDTTRDEFVFYDNDILSYENFKNHQKNLITLEKAMKKNAKERSRRFMSINTKKNAEWIHEKVKERSVSLFEPRPELNHATNTLCIVGRRSLTNHLFLDRRSFLNSYDYSLDPDGKFLLNILNAAAPVCGGINLEYYFSRVDNEKLGAGTKLPHNVMGLNAVANGIEGDLRPGLPLQMIEVHNPLRLLIIVEHFPDVVLNTIKTNPATYEWFANNWIHLIVVNPETNEHFLFQNGQFKIHESTFKEIPKIQNLEKLIENYEDDIPVHLIS